MIISFRYTVPQLVRLDNPKTVTRRIQKRKTFEKWLKFWKEGKLVHQAWTASPYAPGAIALGEIRLAQFPPPYLERLGDMTEVDLELEGGMTDSVEEFIKKYFKGKENAIATVLTFELVSCNLAARHIFLGASPFPEKILVDIPF